MAQKFSLYGDLSVRAEPRLLRAASTGSAARSKRDAIDRDDRRLSTLAPLSRRNAGTLPLGFKQRLALACAIMHDPPVLFLDEPTSGVDPITRREFWAQSTPWSASGVTVMVTTHFMDEAEYCDRVALIYRGKNRHRYAGRLAGPRADPGLPDPTLEDAFIALIEAQDRREAA